MTAIPRRRRPAWARGGWRPLDPEVVLDHLAAAGPGALVLARPATADPGASCLAPLARLRVVKVCNDAGDAVPEGVGRVLPGGDEEASAAEQWEQLLGEELLVVGGTPGGLYRLVRAGAAKGRKVNWAEKFFDLVVVDEASQMGLAEALTAAGYKARAMTL